MSSGETQIPDSSENDSNASGGILATVVPDAIRRNFALKFGIVLSNALSIGPKVSEEQVKNTMSYIEEARDSGAAFLTGGAQPATTQFVSSHDIGPVVIPMISISNSTIGKPLCPESADHDCRVQPGMARAYSSASDSDFVSFRRVTARIERQGLVTGTNSNGNRCRRFRRVPDELGPVVGFVSPVDARESVERHEYSLERSRTRFRGTTGLKAGLPNRNGSAVVMSRSQRRCRVLVELLRSARTSRHDDQRGERSSVLDGTPVSRDIPSPTCQRAYTVGTHRYRGQTGSSSCTRPIRRLWLRDVAVRAHRDGADGVARCGRRCDTRTHGLGDR